MSVKKLWNQAATDLCPCGEKQTKSHIVDSSSAEVKWRLVSATLSWWWSYCLADQLRLSLDAYARRKSEV